MTHDIANILKGRLNTLPFKDVLEGLVRPAKVVKGGVEKTFPLTYNINPNTCSNGQLLALTPDSTKRSIIYFEDGGTTLRGEDGGYLLLTTSLKLICWFNYKRIDTTLYESAIIALNILKLIPDRLPNNVPYLGILIRFTGQDSRESNPFTKYTYDEPRTQFITYPYDWVALNFAVDYKIARDCIDDIILNPDACPT